MKTSSRIAWIVCITSCISCLTVATRAQVCLPEFAEQPSFAVGRNAGTSALVDLNEDGNLDLIIGLSFFLGDGTGLFDTRFRLPATPQVPEGFDVKAADFDLDGHLDLAMVMIGGPHMNFFYGRGYHEDPSELFDRPRSVDIRSTVQGVWHIDTTDFNGDGLTDVVGISIVSSNVLVLLNRGDREFDRTKYVVNGGVGRGGNHMLTTGDFDGDGRSDVAAGFGGEFFILFGDGAGGFDLKLNGQLKHQGRFINRGHRFRSGDLDGDGRSELFATGGDSVLVYLGRDIDRAALPANASHRLRVGNGVGVRFLEIKDVNSDGVLDVTAVAEAGPRSMYRTFLTSVSDGVPSFVAGEAHTTNLSGHGSVLAVGDADGDFALDIVLTTEDTGRGQVFLNTAVCRSPVVRGDANADGSFNIGDAVAVANFLFVGGPIACAPAAEVNGDGTVNISDVVSILNYLFGGGPPPVDPGPVSCG